MNIKLFVKEAYVKYKNKYEITASGYFGDMDTLFHYNESFNVSSIEQIGIQLKLFQMIEDDEIRLRAEAEDWISENYPQYEYQIYIPDDEGDQLPSCIEEVKILYYDNQGIPHEVEVEYV